MDVERHQRKPPLVPPACLRPTSVGQRQNLIERALLREFVGPPPDEGGCVTEATALETVEGHLAHEVGLQRDPRLILGTRPPADPTGAPSFTESTLALD